jgi:hypothetical protein
VLSNAFEFEYDRSESIDATVDGNTFLFEPREVCAEAQESDISIDGNPGRTTETFRHLQRIHNELLTVPEQVTRFKRLNRRHRALFENFRWMKTLQDCYLNLMKFNHLNQLTNLNKYASS